MKANKSGLKCNFDYCQDPPSPLFGTQDKPLLSTN